MDLPNFLKRALPAKADAGSGNDPRALRGDGDAIATAVATFLTRTGLFDRETYAASNPEVAKTGIDPLHHFMRFGIQAGRNFTTPQTIARLWREVLREKAEPQPRAHADTSQFRVALYVSSLGNFFMTEIAQILLAGFGEAGITARLHDEKSSPQQDATHHIVVAPHEFFVLGDGKKWARDDFVSRAILFSTEQVQTQWFARSLVFLLRAKAVADMNAQTTAILRKGGVPAITVQPGFARSFKPFTDRASLAKQLAFASLSPAVHDFDANGKPLAARPLDVLFLGSTSRRREKLLASYAPKFASLDSYIYATRTSRPLDPASNPTAAPQVTAALLQRSKILLNLHRDEYTYFEWWRLMQAFWQKTLVVTEPCFPHPLYQPGIHFLAEAPRHIPHLINWLVASKDGQAKAEEIRNRAFTDFTANSTAASAALALLHAGEAT